MSTKAIALKLDAQDRPVETAAAYERAILDSAPDLEVYLNLAVLYFQCTDPGYFSLHRLPDDFIQNAWARANALLTEAELQCGWHAEIEFWGKYFPFVRLGEGHFYETCERLIRQDISLVPYFYLVGSPGGEEHVRKAQELLEAVKRGVTARERYIRGMLGPKLIKAKAIGKEIAD